MIPNCPDCGTNFDTQFNETDPDGQLVYTCDASHAGHGPTYFSAPPADPSLDGVAKPGIKVVKYDLHPLRLRHNVKNTEIGRCDRRFNIFFQSHNFCISLVFGNKHQTIDVVVWIGKRIVLGLIDIDLRFFQFLDHADQLCHEGLAANVHLLIAAN